MAIGNYDQALTSYAAGARVALRLHDSAQGAGIMANIGCAYEDVGMFHEADICYSHSIRHNAIDRNSRVSVTSHVNVAQMALIRGEFDRAVEHVELARHASDKTHSWRLAALVDFSQADVLLAIGETGRAWPILARAAANTWGKERALDTNGKQIRLTLYLALVTGGKQRLRALVNDLAAHRRPMRLAHMIEVAGFLAWTVRTGVLDSSYVRDCGFEVELGKLGGPLAILSAVGTPAREEWACQPGESALEMIARSFAPAMDQLLPQASSLLPEVDVFN
jgi:tetratricopeptide (TPR) repeat protein